MAGFRTQASAQLVEEAELAELGRRRRGQTGVKRFGTAAGRS